ncbi:MAG: DUF4332 domain-containing protein [Chlorobium sp.]|nr:DUF4332 domain-containing protein [Chlorobium sp.]
MDIIINDRPCRGSVGEKLSKIALESKSHVGYVCAGLGICQTCYVTVLEGGECLSPLSNVERAFLSEKQIAQGARLACQTTVIQEGMMRVLSRPEEVRRMILSNPLSLFSYSVDMGKSAAERFVPGVTNVIDRISKGEMQGQEALDDVLSGMGSALQFSMDAAKESIPFKEQINGMVDFCRKMLPFSDNPAPCSEGQSLERVALTISAGNKGKEPLHVEPAGMSITAEFEPLGSDVAEKLQKVGIQNCSELLERGKNPSGRQALVADLDLQSKEVLTLVNYADLCRITGISVKRASLLESAGVDTVPELAQRNPAHLFEKIQKINKTKKILQQLPSKQDVAAWIAEAKKLPRVMTY